MTRAPTVDVPRVSGGAIAERAHARTRSRKNASANPHPACVCAATKAEAEAAPLNEASVWLPDLGSRRPWGSGVARGLHHRSAVLQVVPPDTDQHRRHDARNHDVRVQ